MPRKKKKKVYIATTLQNQDTYKLVKERMEKDGIHITHDWTTHGEVHSQQDLQRVAHLELDGVRHAHLVFAITPAGTGSHFEMGYATALGKPVLIWEDEPIERYKSFYRLNTVIIDRSLDRIFKTMDIIFAHQFGFKD